MPKRNIEGKFLDAYKQWSLALQLNPQHPIAKWGVGELDKEARKLYQEGIKEEAGNPDLARIKWNEILGIVPPDHEMYRKAEQKLAQ